MGESVIIIGASGHGRVIADIVVKSGDKVKGFLDDAENLPDNILGFPVLGKIQDFEKYLQYSFIIAIGDEKIRENIDIRLNSKVRWYTAVHPTAVISSLGVTVGAGTVVMANAVINSCACIGRHCIINTAAVVEHDNEISDFVHLSPGVTLAGTVKVGMRTHIGVGAVVRNNIEICQDSIVGAGATVVKDITLPGVYIGVPAERRK